MKTVAWTPSPHLLTAEFAIDDEVVFYSAPAQVDKRTTLMGALLAAAGYAAMNLAFELRNKHQEVLMVFEPGTPVRGYPSLCQSVLEIAVHMDKRVEATLERANAEVKAAAVSLYERGVADGIAAERERIAGGGAEQGASAEVPDAPATPVAETAPEPQAPASTA
jgi:hypothetical protein